MQHRGLTKRVLKKASNYGIIQISNERIDHYMKKFLWLITIIIALSLSLSGCVSSPDATLENEDETVWLNMNTTYQEPTKLPDGGGERVKVILLIGQSNATGCGLNDYLKKNLGDETYATYEAGFPSVLINYCLDDHRTSSNGEFVKVDMTCGATNGYFGAEVGLAETLSKTYKDETILILKYSMSGYSLHYHWLSQGKRGSIYEAFLAFAQTYLEALREAHYDPRIGAICWMQGESDTTDFKAQRYYENQTKFVSYLREDLATYAEEGGIYFIDAGISNSPYCEPAYPTINAAKEKFAQDSPLNLYFSTIDEGLTVHLEPEGEPDLGHYDSMSVLKLGHLFGEHVIYSYQLRDTQY